MSTVTSAELARRVRQHAVGVPGSGFAATDSDRLRLAECARRGLQTVTDLGEFTRCKVDPLLLHIRTDLLRGCCLDDVLQLPRHVLYDMGEFGDLPGDERYVRLIRHRVLGRSLGTHSPNVSAPEPSLPRQHGDSKTQLAPHEGPSS